MVPLFSAAFAAPNKDTAIFFTDLDLQKQLNPPVNGKIQGLLKGL